MSIAEIWWYPITSMAYELLATRAFDTGGAWEDRRFAALDLSSGRVGCNNFLHLAPTPTLGMTAKTSLGVHPAVMQPRSVAQAYAVRLDAVT